MVGSTRVPRSEETPPSYDPTVGLYLGSYGGPRGVGVFHERGTPVGFTCVRRDSRGGTGPGSPALEFRVQGLGFRG